MSVSDFATWVETSTLNFAIAVFALIGIPALALGVLMWLNYQGAQRLKYRKNIKEVLNE